MDLIDHHQLEVAAVDQVVAKALIGNIAVRESPGSLHLVDLLDGHQPLVEGVERPLAIGRLAAILLGQLAQVEIHERPVQAAALVVGGPTTGERQQLSLTVTRLRHHSVPLGVLVPLSRGRHAPCGER
ncbi:hypothetical protein HALA3H3_p20010 [Halomonas sp. A3H3]|nr:hypothetical protein HALA3H3_p20010 [Halomonas sp. A3H3]